MLPSSTSVLFKSAKNNVSYIGLRVTNPEDCVNWLNGPVRARAYDAEEITALEDFMRVEGFDNSELYAAITTSDEQLTEKDIGETMAELALQARMQAIWPTNRRRDMRSVRASLPGADIVGFAPCEGEGHQFIFAEVKTSSDKKAPPAVMYGDKGLEYQLHTLATDRVVLRRLLIYSYSRVRGTPLMKEWREAFACLANDYPGGAKLVGVLVRDTMPQEKDVSHHASILSGKLPESDNISLMALYICVQAKDWPQHCKPI